MKYTAKHDKDLIDKVIKRYEDYLKNESWSYCAFCVDGKKYSTWEGWMCDKCVLVRRFGKQCFDYPSYQMISDFRTTPKKAKKRIAVLKRLKHYIKED